MKTIILKTIILWGLAIIATATSELSYPRCLDAIGDCEWYKNCLETEYNCGNDTNNYPSGFAYPVCSEMMRQRDLFTEAGQRWVDGVRMCLQERIVPTLKQLGPEATCTDAEEQAFLVHYDCYIENGYCQILYDWPRILNIVKHSLFSRKWQTVISQGFAIYTTCLFG